MQLAPAPSARDILRLPAEILAVVIGDDSNSRLYWELIEPGDAEAAELGYNDYDGSGAFMTFLSCRPEDTARLLAKMEQEATANRIDHTRHRFPRGILRVQALVDPKVLDSVAPSVC